MSSTSATIKWANVPNQYTYSGVARAPNSVVIDEKMRQSVLNDMIDYTQNNGGYILDRDVRMESYGLYSLTSEYGVEEVHQARKTFAHLEEIQRVRALERYQKSDAQSFARKKQLTTRERIINNMGKQAYWSFSRSHIASRQTTRQGQFAPKPTGTDRKKIHTAQFMKRWVNSQIIVKHYAALGL